MKGEWKIPFKKLTRHSGVTMTYHFGGKKSMRIFKGEKILKNIKENET